MVHLRFFVARPPLQLVRYGNRGIRTDPHRVWRNSHSDKPIRASLGFLRDKKSSFAARIQMNCDECQGTLIEAVLQFDVGVWCGQYSNRVGARSDGDLGWENGHYELARRLVLKRLLGNC